MAKGNGTARNALRSKIFAQHSANSKVIQLFGEDVEVRQPSIGEVLEAREDSTSDRDTLVSLMVRYCYVPGTTERIFEETDSGAIMEWPIGKWFTDFNNAISELTDIDVVSAEGNSDETEDSLTSSP